MSEQVHSDSMRFGGALRIFLTDNERTQYDDNDGDESDDERGNNQHPVEHLNVNKRNAREMN